MQKILTAMGNLDLNKKLKEMHDFDVYENDIIYKEGIIEILKKNNNFDVIIIYEKLPGEIKIQELIKNIKSVNSKIKIIFILEDKNEQLENLLLSENIKNIFYNKEINFLNFISEIKKLQFSEEDNLKKEIKELKEEIFNKNREIQNYKNNILIENNKNTMDKNCINLKKIREKNIFFKEDTNIIIILSKNKNQEKEFLNNLFFYLKNKKITIINLQKNIDNKRLKNIFYNKNNNKFNNKIKLLNFNLYMKKNNYNKNSIEKIINNLLENLSAKNDFIFILLNNNIKYNKYFMYYSKKIILILNNKIKEIEKLENTVNSMNLRNMDKSNKLKILFNSNCINPISRKILKKIMYDYDIIGYLKLKEKYNFFEKIIYKNKYLKIIN